MRPKPLMFESLDPAGYALEGRALSNPYLKPPNPNTLKAQRYLKELESMDDLLKFVRLLAGSLGGLGFRVEG